VGAVLTTAGVRHRRGGREVLRIDALEVHAGERLGLLGLNGAGKTSLLRLFAAIDLPTTGEVRIDGIATADGGASLRRRIAYAPQRPVMLSMSVRQNVELPLRYRAVGRDERRARATAVLARLGIEQLADRPAPALSAGEAQRVSLARALVSDPDVLLLDEPAVSLDAPTRAAFLADVDAALADRAATVVLVSHRADEVLPLADRAAVLVAGELRQLASTTDLMTLPADAAVARLVGYDNVVDVEIDKRGSVLLAGRATGLHVPPGPRTATLIAWASAVRVQAPRAGALAATVTRIRTFQGRHELTLAAGTELRAHLPLDTDPPMVGDEIAIDFDAALTRVLDPPARDRLRA
jgi:ABC-type sugar transport system ATPase subunit